MKKGGRIMKRRNKMALAAAVLGLTTMALSSGVSAADAVKDVNV